MTPKWIRRELAPGEVVLHIARPSWLRVVAVLVLYVAIGGPLGWALGTDWATFLVANPITIFAVCLFFNRSRIVLTNKRVLYRDAMRSLDPPDAFDHGEIRAIESVRRGFLCSVDFNIRNHHSFGIYGVKDADALIERSVAALANPELRVRDHVTEWRTSLMITSPALVALFGTFWLSYLLISRLWPVITDDGACQIIPCFAADLMMIPVVAAAFVICARLTVPLSLTLWYPFLRPQERRDVAAEISAKPVVVGDFCLRLFLDLSTPITRRYLTWLFGKSLVDQPEPEPEGPSP